MDAHLTAPNPVPVLDWNCDFECEATGDGRDCYCVCEASEVCFDCVCDCESMVEAAVSAAQNADTTPQEPPEPGIVGNNLVQHGARTPSTPQACWACAASIARTVAAFPFIPRHLSKPMC